MEAQPIGQLARIDAVVGTALFEEGGARRIADHDLGDIGGETVVEPGRPSAVFKGQEQFAASSLDELDDRAPLGLDHRFHDQFPVEVQDSDLYRCGVHIHGYVFRVLHQGRAFLSEMRTRSKGTTKGCPSLLAQRFCATEPVERFLGGGRTAGRWGNRCHGNTAASPGEVGRGVQGARRALVLTFEVPPDLFRIEHGNEAKRSTVGFPSLSVVVCSCIKGCHGFTKSKGRQSILRGKLGCEVVHAFHGAALPPRFSSRRSRSDATRKAPSSGPMSGLVPRLVSACWAKISTFLARILRQDGPGTISSRFLDPWDFPLGLMPPSRRVLCTSTHHATRCDGRCERGDPEYCRPA